MSALQGEPEQPGAVSHPLFDRGITESMRCADCGGAVQGEARYRGGEPVWYRFRCIRCGNLYQMGTNTAERAHWGQPCACHEVLAQLLTELLHYGGTATERIIRRSIREGVARDDAGKLAMSIPWVLAGEMLAVGPHPDPCPALDAYLADPRATRR